MSFMLPPVEQSIVYDSNDGQFYAHFLLGKKEKKHAIYANLFYNDNENRGRPEDTYKESKIYFNGKKLSGMKDDKAEIFKKIQKISTYVFKVEEKNGKKKLYLSHRYDPVFKEFSPDVLTKEISLDLYFLNVILEDRKIKVTALNKMRNVKGNYDESMIFINGKKLREINENRIELYNTLSSSAKFELKEKYILTTNTTEKTLHISFDS